MTDDPEAEPMARLVAIMAALRDPERGCPWDVQQTFATIAPYTIEEAYEVADAIERNALDDLKDELGDLLLQVVFHARMAEELGTFSFPDVARAIADKLVRRHPHVFADARFRDADAQTAAWETQKAEERATKQRSRHATTAAPSALHDIPAALPALMRAQKLQKRAAHAGFDWPDALGAIAKLREESVELLTELADSADPRRIEDEVGDLLFTCVNIARKLGVDAENALRGANGKFTRRFQAMEARARNDGGIPLSARDLAALEALWTEAKKEVEDQTPES